MKCDSVGTSISGMGGSERQTVDVAVIGGGIIGLAVAWRARQRGLSVTVLERGRAGEGASSVAAGMLAPVAEVEFGEHGRRLLELGLRSARMWPAFAAEVQAASGVEVALTQTGTLMVARDDDEARELERQLALRESLGLRAVRLRASQAREREPALAPTVRLALAVPDDHAVDPRRAVAALLAACERAGVDVREHAPVAGVQLDAQGRRVTGVALAEPGVALAEPGALAEPEEARVQPRRSVVRPGGGAGPFFGGGEAVISAVVSARNVVVAAGAWSGGIGGLPDHARVPVRPVKGQIMRLRDPAGPGLLEGIVRFQGGYLVPRGDGRYVLGGTMEERAFEAEPTVGGVYEIVRNAHELVPGVSELLIEEVDVGYRPGSPDNAPAIGPGALEGLTWATGHHRNGILLAPLTAEIVAGLLAGNGAAGETMACTPSRFAPSHSPSEGDVILSS